jgi:hypothetical protein
MHLAGALQVNDKVDVASLVVGAPSHRSEEQRRSNSWLRPQRPPQVTDDLPMAAQPDLFSKRQRMMSTGPP